MPSRLYLTLPDNRARRLREDTCDLRVGHRAFLQLRHAGERARQCFTEHSHLLAVDPATYDGEQFPQHGRQHLCPRRHASPPVEEIDNGRHLGGARQGVKSWHRTHRFIGFRHRTGHCGGMQTRLMRPSLRLPTRPIKLQLHPSYDDPLVLPHGDRAYGFSFHRASCNKELTILQTCSQYPIRSVYHT